MPRHCAICGVAMSDQEIDAAGDRAHPECVDYAADLSAQLRTAGAHLAAARSAQRHIMARLRELLPAATAAGVSEAKAARAAGVDRMTVRRLLGKPPGRYRRRDTPEG